MASVTESILLSVQTRGTESLDAAAKSFNNVSKSADRAGKEIDGAASRADRAGRRTEKLRDRLGDVATMFRDSGDGGMIFADALDAAAVATTPLGAGILTLVAGFASAKIAVDAASASLSLYIETNDEAAAASTRLEESTAGLNESVIDLVAGQGGLAAAMQAAAILSDRAAAATEKLRASTQESTDALRAETAAAGLLLTPLTFAIEASRSLVNANELLSQSNLGLVSSFGSVVSAASSAAGAIASAASSAASSFAVILGLQESATSATIRRGISALAQSPVGKALGEAGVLTFPGQAPRRRGGGGGGGGAAAAARRRKALESDLAKRNLAFIEQQYAGLISRLEPDAASADDITGGLIGDPSFLAAREAEGGNILAAGRRAREAAAAAAKEDEERQRQAAELREERMRALEAEAAAVARLAGTYREVLQGSLAGLGVTAATTFGEMTAGAVSAADAMRSLAKEILGVGTAIGRTAAQRGVEGLIAGTAGAGGVLAGGLGIAAGAGVLGAILARRQRRRERGRGGDSTARLAESIDRLEQTLRPDRADTPVTLNAEIVIAGRTVQQELTGALDSIVRTRSSRELFRAGIGR